MATWTLTVSSQNVGMQSGQRISCGAAQTLALEDSDLLCVQAGRALRNDDCEDSESMTALNRDFIMLGDGPRHTRT